MPKKTYESEFAEEIARDIENTKLKNRPFIKMQFLKRRREFGLPCKLNETDASEKMQDIKQINDPFMHQKNKVINIGL